MQKKTMMNLLLTLAMLLSHFVPLSTLSSDVTAAPGGGPVDALPKQIELPTDEFNEGEGGGSGLQLNLSEGAETSGPLSRPVAAETTALDAETIQTILDRLPPLEEEVDDTQAFRLPSESLPPPRTGETVNETFPPTEGVMIEGEVASGPLEVLRFAPEGEVNIAPFVNVTFNQPMVPLGTLQDLAAEEVPVVITPAIEGVWKWLGTRTLSFEHVSEEIDRFPKATEFTVEVPAGTESATGGILSQPVSWTFRTPPPVVRRFHPSSHSPQPRDPIFFVSFDQRIDAEAVLETIRVSAGGDDFTIEMVPEDELADDNSSTEQSNGEADEDKNLQRIRQMIESSGESRWLAFRATKLLPENTTVTVDIGPGTPSAEGPLTTEAVQSYSFQTYAPLRIVEHTCGYGGDCPPLSPFNIRFNNSLDEPLFEESLLTIEPEIPNLNVNLFGNNLVLQGLTQGRATYKVTFAGNLTDIFGQTLGQEESVTFDVGPARPLLVGPSNNYITLDPSSVIPQISIYSVNYSGVDLKLYHVTPSDWLDFVEFRQNYYGDRQSVPPGELVLDERLSIQSEPDQMVETSIDLTPGLGKSGTGHMIVVVNRPPESIRVDDYSEPIMVWVQITQIGLDAFVDHGQLIAWTTSLQDGSPLTDISLSLLPGAGNQETQESDETGTAIFELPTDEGAQVLVAQKGTDSAFLPESPYGYSGGWRAYEQTDQLAWYVIDDRQMYRPGEEVHVKGWLRRIGSGPQGDVTKSQNINTIRYRLMGPQGNDITTGEIELNAAGGFDLALTLPEGINLGYANLMLSAEGNASDLNSREYWHSFQIQEFRRPEFEVSAGNDTTGPYYLGDEAVVFVEASYFAGGGLPNAETSWDVNANPTTYSPPNWPDYTFGKWVPWWFHYGSFGGDSGNESAYQSFFSTTDASGKHYLNLQLTSGDSQTPTDPQPYSVVANATVLDVNRQAWTSSTTLMFHPAAFYVGLRTPRYFVNAGEPLEVDMIVTDIDGEAIGGQEVEIVASRLEWKFSKGEWNEEEVDTQTCIIKSTAFPEVETLPCSFKTDMGGRYRIRATVTDDEGRTNLTELTRWVSGGSRPSVNRVEQEEVTLIPDKEEYQPGDVAEILVQSPFAPAEGRLTLSRDGILESRTFSLDESTIVLRIPVEDGHVPNLTVQVDINGATGRLGSDGTADPELPSRPAFAMGQLELVIPPTSRTLSIAAEPAATALAPGESTELSVTVVDADGEAVVGAELAVIVVDEAILALTGYQLTDPLSVFYYSRGSNLSSRYSRGSIVLTDPTALADQITLNQSAGDGDMMMRSAMPMAGAAAPMAMESAMAESEESLSFAADDGAMEKSSQGEAIQLRSNFNPLALFAPEVQTDGDGQATVDINLPDNLTRYRIMVVAANGDNHFGSTEANLTARLPLMVRPSQPRFLRFGDSFELPIVLQNQTDEAMDVEVVVQAGNITLNDATDANAAGQSVKVPANDRVEVRFPAETVSAGNARFQVAAVSGDYQDAATIDQIPVYTPATTEAFATYGVIDEGATVQPLLPPSDVFPQFGGLEIETSSTALQALTDALIYLTRYPYECSEQVASRIMAVATLRDVLSAFDAEQLPPAEELEAAVERDLETLSSLQNFDGGYPVWRRGKESIPYYSIFVTHTLYKAGEKGFDVPADMQQNGLDYLRQIENYYPSWYSPMTRDTLSAYALYVRQLLRDVDTSKARDLFDRTGINGLSLEGQAWLLHLLGPDAGSQQQADEIRRNLANRVVETTGAANFTTSYGDDEYVMLHSNRRTDGVILDVLMSDQPDSDLIPKVVTGLLAHRVRGHWRNTQENAFILLALDRYFNIYEAQTPDFVAQVWLGEEYVGSHEFQGRTTERSKIDVPMSFITGEEGQNQGETTDLIVNKDGDGRLYYRLGLRYAPTDLNMPPVDMGFVVQRTYEAVDDEDDVTQDEDGTWRIKAGARVRVRLSMVADNRRYHVALVDPLPAGLEIINPALAVSDVPTDPTDTSRPYWWWGTWYEHQNLRDDRAEAFTTLLWDGVYEYSYVARATTPGEFVASPTKAEEMYSPEVFGRSGSDRVVVE